jgi:malate/lactate dehydrogenase
MPCILDKNGIEQQPAITLTKHELELLQKSADSIKKEL